MNGRREAFHRRRLLFRGPAGTKAHWVRLTHSNQRARPAGAIRSTWRWRAFDRGRWGAVWGGLLLLASATPCAAASAPKQVLILDSFGREVAPFAAAVSAFRTTLARELGGRSISTMSP